MIRAGPIVGALLWLIPVRAAAEGEQLAPKLEEIERDQGLNEPADDRLPPHLLTTHTSFWSVGMALEGYGTDDDQIDGLVGLAAAFRLSWFGPNALIMVKPDTDGYEGFRFLAGLGLRAHFSLFDRAFSYGIGVHAEARLEDHFWLAYATPIELGMTLYDERSWDVQLFVGARRVIAGELIDSYLVDPNGFNNDSARDALDGIKHDTPWTAFVRVVFARRIH